jgi:hypothetical protein
MVGVQCLDHALAFLKNLLDLEEDAEMPEQEPGPSASHPLCRRSEWAQTWGFHSDINAELEKCLTVLKIHCEKANELIKYTTSMARALCKVI